MNTKVWYLPYFEGVYHTRTVETYSNANARMVCMVHTMDVSPIGNHRTFSIFTIAFCVRNFGLFVRSQLGK